MQVTHLPQQTELLSLRRRKYLQNAGPLFVRYAVLIIVALFILIPIATAFVGSVKSSGELLSRPFAIPTIWHWENYSVILTDITFWQAIANSVITMLATVGLLLLVACPAAFVFARVPFRGREVIFNIMLIGLLFPPTMAILPLFITLRNLQLLNSLPGLIIPQIAFGLASTILILRNFFKAIPLELEDATYIDGGTQIDFFWRILLPLARPILAVVSMLTMVGSWNNFLLPLLVLNDQSLWTLPLGVMQYQTEHQTNWPEIMAFISLAMIPAIIFYLLAERYLIAGLTAGAVKG